MDLFDAYEVTRLDKTTDDWKVELPSVSTLMKWNWPKFGKYRDSGKTFGEVVFSDYNYVTYLLKWPKLDARTRAILEAIIEVYEEWRGQKAAAKAPSKAF